MRGTTRQEQLGGSAPAAKPPRPSLPTQLNRSATLNEFVKRIRLPSPHIDLKPGTVCYVMGWGDISNFGDQPAELMETNTTIVKRSLCRTLWRGKVSANMLCGASRNTTLQGVCAVSAPLAPCPTLSPTGRPSDLPPTPSFCRVTPGDPWSSRKRFMALSHSLGRDVGTAASPTSTPRSPTTLTGCITLCEGPTMGRGGRSPRMAGRESWGQVGCGKRGQDVLWEGRRGPELPCPPALAGLGADARGSLTQVRAGAPLYPLARDVTSPLGCTRSPSCILSQWRRLPSSINPQSPSHCSPSVFWSP